MKNRRLLPLVFIFTLLFISKTFAQTGKISGVVKDSLARTALPFANVAIEGLNTGAATDTAGKYKLSVKPGVYKVTVTCFGYRHKFIENVKVTEGQTTTLHVDLAEDIGELDAIIINVPTETNTENAVLNEIKNSEQVVSGISSEQISKSQDRDAGQAMQRIPGITLMNNRFIMIRGLSERYNTVMINDAISPSTDPERRSFAFDLIPSNLLDRMLVYKSGAADIPGDFAGGVIKIYTKNVPDSNIVSIGLTLGYRNGTTFKPFNHTQYSGTDFLGFDNGFRHLPSDFPAALTNGNSEKASKSLNNNWDMGKNNALPDLRFNFDLGRVFKIGGKEAGTIASLNYSNTYQYFKAYRARYNAFNESTQSSPKQNEFTDDQYTRNVRLGVVSNWFLKFNHYNKIEFKNMFNQLGEDETIIRNGVSITQRPEDSLRNYSFRYASRSIYSSQISGTHDFNESVRTSFHWVAGFNYFNSQTPDLRRVRTYKKMGTSDSYKVIIPPTATTFDAARFFSDLKEYTVMTSGNLEHKLYNPDKDSTGISLKAGYYVERKSRDFAARWMSYKYNSSAGGAADSLSYLPLDQIFDPRNISYKNLLYLTEGTNFSDSYQAQNFLSAGYANFLIPFRKLNLAAGARVEFNKLSLQSRTTQGNVDVNRPVTSILPFFNLSYSISDKMLARVAYSKTVNRPEFREIAPFLFYNFELNADFVGNPDLVTANIHNADVRWEFYPGFGETFSIGGFYKRFVKPIETYIRQGADNPIFTFGNAEYANSFGGEMEIRKSLKDVSKNSFIRNLSLVFNGSLIYSRVELGANAVAQASSRPLQGQSPYVINGGLFYINDDKGIMANLMYNIFGQRIFTVGDRSNPTVYELPRHSLDFSLSKRIAKTMDVRFGVQDILNYRTKMVQDSNEDNKITSVDETFLSFRRGSYYTIGFGYRF